jgi:hypothetical protein
LPFGSEICRKLCFRARRCRNEGVPILAVPWLRGARRRPGRRPVEPAHERKQVDWLRLRQVGEPQASIGQWVMDRERGQRLALYGPDGGSVEDPAPGRLLNPTGKVRGTLRWTRWCWLSGSCCAKLGDEEGAVTEEPLFDPESVLETAYRRGTRVSTCELAEPCELTKNQPAASGRLPPHSACIAAAPSSPSRPSVVGPSPAARGAGRDVSTATGG